MQHRQDNDKRNPKKFKFRISSIESYYGVVIYQNNW